MDSNSQLVTKPLHSTHVLKGELFGSMPMQTSQRPTDFTNGLGLVILWPTLHTVAKHLHVDHGTVHPQKSSTT